MNSARWLNRTVLGIGLASLFCDWCQEAANAVMPAFLATLGASAAWLGIIEGVSDGLASLAKMSSGLFTDKLERRKPMAVAGYAVSALGTAAIGLSAAAWQVLLARSVAWLGRGCRTPVRKALLAAAVDRSTFGRAFGFERMMDTAGAVAGPATALFLLTALRHRYSWFFAATLAPGLLAALVLALLVKETARKPVGHISLGAGLRQLPATYKELLAAVGLYGAGRFAHTLLILLATRQLTPQYGAAKAASIAVALYIMHNVVQAGFGYFGGWLADRLPKKWLLAAGYLLGAAMGGVIVAGPASVGSLSIVFILGGVSAALEDTVEDAFCAELVEDSRHGLAFGLMATINGVGDFLSSTVVGLLWTWAGPAAAFGYSAALSAAGAFLVARVSSKPA